MQANFRRSTLRASRATSPLNPVPEPGELPTVHSSTTAQGTKSVIATKGVSQTIVHRDSTLFGHGIIPSGELPVVIPELPPKDDTKIQFQIESLSLDFIVSAEGAVGKVNNYRMFALCEHEGNQQEGLFSAYCCDVFHHIRAEQDKWYEFRNEEVKVVTVDDVAKRNPYLLFYVKVEKDID